MFKDDAFMKRLCKKLWKGLGKKQKGAWQDTQRLAKPGSSHLPRAGGAKGGDGEGSGQGGRATWKDLRSRGTRLLLRCGAEAGRTGINNPTALSSCPGPAPLATPRSQRAGAWQCSPQESGSQGTQLGWKGQTMHLGRGWQRRACRKGSTPDDSSSRLPPSACCVP